MTNRKSTPKALLGSVVALVLCAALLLGTTLAWFTDTATTSVSSIQAGTLDVELVDAAGQPIGEKIDFVDAPQYLEPGVTLTLPAVYVQNNGNLGLKYELQLHTGNGDNTLMNALVWSVNGVEVTDLNQLATGTLNAKGTVKGKTDEIKITATLPSTTCNIYQNAKLDSVKLVVVATQVNDNAALPKVAFTSQQVKDTLSGGGNVVVQGDVEVTEAAQISEGSTTIEGAKIATNTRSAEGYTSLTAADDATRVLTIQGTTEKTELTVRNLNVVGPNDRISSRVISAYNNKNLTINLENASVVNPYYYGLYIAGQNPNATINATDSTLQGYAAVVIWSKTTANFVNSTLIGRNDFKTESGATCNNYSTVVFGTDSGSSSTGSEFTFTDCTIQAVETDYATQYLFGFNNSEVTVTLENCTLLHTDENGNTTVVTADTLANYIDDYDNTNVVITEENGVITIRSTINE